VKTDYRPHKNLPPLAGLCSFEEAARPGLSIEEGVARLKRFHYAFKRLMQIYHARLTAEPIYELKMAFSLHSHYCAEHCTAMRERVAEMRTPPLGLEKVPHAALETFFAELEHARGTEALVLGIYGHAVPAVVRGLRAYMEQTHPLADHPTLRLLRFALLEMTEVEQYGSQAVTALVSAEQRVALAGWEQVLVGLLSNAGDLDGCAAPTVVEVARHFSADPAPHDTTPRRDERFPDPYNMGVHAEEFLYDPRFKSRDKTLMMYYKRLREIDVPEMMATILTQTPDKPWTYYKDMTRQLWDEARHAMMGEVGFVSLGLDWPQLVMVNFTWSLGLNAQLQPWERHAVLYFIEQGLMTKTGKRFEWKVGSESGDPLSKTFQDYDWADEVLHARIGKDWYVSAFGDQKEAIEFGSQCWSKVLSNWSAWKEMGKTEHRNWWPGLYEAFCRARLIEPDAAALKFNTTYEAIRADLEQLPASA
jgi:hypothetical protein